MITNKFTFVFCVIFLIGCANNPIRSYKNDSDKFLKQITVENNLIESKTFGNPKNSDILFNLEYGTYLRFKNKYTNSDYEFKNAQNSIDTWVNNWSNSTTGNLGINTTQLLINDNVTDYQTKGFEKTMLAAYRALNHIDNNNWSNARIEIKKMYQLEQALENYNQFLYMQAKSDQTNIINDKNKNLIYQDILRKYNFKDINNPEILALKNSYQLAFSHYLAGYIFEALNEPSLSRPGYVKSGQLMPLNKLTKDSIDNLDNGKTNKQGSGNLLIIEEVGHAPQIKSTEIHIPFVLPTNNNCITNINLFFPILQYDKNAANSYSYFIDNNLQQQELYANFDLMAKRNLHDIMPHIIMRNITAAMRNISISLASCNQNSDVGNMINFAGIIAGALLDKADERSWVLLPSKIYLNRIVLEFGKHKFKININGKDYLYDININKSYQILSLRIMADKIFFMQQDL